MSLLPLEAFTWMVGKHARTMLLELKVRPELVIPALTPEK
jgi:hypothetical protein